MIVLIESSAEFPSVALCNVQGDVLWDEVGTDKQSHAEKLPMMVQRAVEFVQAQGASIVAIALGVVGQYFWIEWCWSVQGSDWTPP